MIPFNTDAAFVVSLDKAQREYYLGRLAELQHQLQDALRDLSRGLSAVSTMNSEAFSLLSINFSKPLRTLSVDGIEYRFATLPGSGRIKLSCKNGVPIAMWEAGRKDPWVLPLEGFDSFLRTGHANALHQQLLAVDRRRRVQ